MCGFRKANGLVMLITEYGYVRNARRGKMNRKKTAKLSDKTVRLVDTRKKINSRGMLSSKTLGVCSGFQAGSHSVLTPLLPDSILSNYSGKNENVIKLTINRIPPSRNHCYGHRGNRMYTKKEGKEFKEFVGTLIPPNFIPWKGDVKLEIHYIFGDKRKHDLDNYLKILLDSFNHRLYVDDNQITNMPLTKEYKKQTRRVHITLTRE